jgi:hypothetical protein
VRTPSTTASDFDSRGALARRGCALAASLLLFLLAGLLTVAPAGATLLHSFDSYMGGGTLAKPEELTVDQTTGDLYVVERASNCISRFYGERGGPEALEPHLFAATGTNKICGLQFREEEEIYGEGTARGQVAVDNSGTSTEGNFYINSPGKVPGDPGVTLGFDNEGHLETELHEKRTPDDYPSLRWVCGVVTDSAGNVYVSEVLGPLVKYTHDDPVTDADFEAELERTGGNCSMAFDNQGVLRMWRFAGTVDHSSGDLYFTERTSVIGSKPDGKVFDEFATGEITESRGVAVDDSTGIVYVSDTPNGRIALYTGTQAYQVAVDLGGTGLGAVSATSGAIEDCGDEGECSGYYAPSTVTLTATPQANSTIQSWTGCDTVSPGGEECTVGVTNQDRGVFVNFNRSQRPVIASTAGTGTGSVSVANGLGAIQGCGDGGTCSGLYDEGSEIHLVATPTGHSTFTGWSGGCSNQSGPCDLVVDGSPSVTAHFTAQHAITVKKAGNGAGSVSTEPDGVDCGGVCTGYFTDGETVQLSALPSGHSIFAGWSGAGCSGTGSCAIEIGDPTQTVVAIFTHDPPAAVTDPEVTFVGQRVATVHGSVNPNAALVTRCIFEYGTGTEYGSEAPCAPSAVGNGESFVPVGVNLSGLQPGTTYHYRVSATSIGGTAYGFDQSFRTLDDTCDSNAALCATPVIRNERPTCRKGFTFKKGRCVRKRRRHKEARRRHGGAHR